MVAVSTAERADEIAERTRAERSAVVLADRFRAHRGHLELVLVDGTTVCGQVRDAAPTWVLLADGPREHLIAMAAVASAAGLTDQVATAAGQVLSRLGLGQALRAVAADRTVVRARAGRTETLGRVDAVGADHLDLAQIDVETLRPTGHRLAIAFGALMVLTSA